MVPPLAPKRSRSSSPAAPVKRPHNQATATLDLSDLPKRGRGRPKKDDGNNDLVNRPGDRPGKDLQLPDPLKRPRGRPRKNPEIPVPPKRPRGRPRKDPELPVPPKRPRGRPRKDTNFQAPQEPLDTSKQGRQRKSITIATSKGPGRPRKLDAGGASGDANNAGSAKRGRGRPRKDSSATVSKSASSKSAKGALSLGQLTGTFDIKCDEVEGNWSNLVEDMSMSITSLKGNPSGLIASFNLGILEGTMLLAADKNTVEAIRRKMERGQSTYEDDDEEKSENDEDDEDEGEDDIGDEGAGDPPVPSGWLHFVWRGRNAPDDDEVHSGAYGGQDGSIKFTNKGNSFKAKGAFPALGESCEFSGKRISTKPDIPPEPWENFNEQAYGSANRSRWF
ncbi:hypothetical protein BDY21DRAFT_182348 [Lineolata rhizophorae]|uniref:Uncharacterized protein n=1 Tax=Lineolata rhizophorae TaxID=578093 RepID=A0A6A6P7J2_9PEZI|nr:hypothetical protein BDY21DRAFT_182348 [Lineolata rhizophorae]